MNEFHTVETDTEKACDAKLEVLKNNWADDDLICLTFYPRSKNAYGEFYCAFFLVCDNN